MKHHIDVLVIGDVVTDAFIRLLPAEADLEMDKAHHPLLCMTYGTKIPFEDVTIVNGVGNSPNAAVACARLGLHASLMSDIGDDHVGDDTLASLSKNRVSTEFVHEHKGYKSNYHYVLWYGADRTILIKHEKYPYKWPEIHEYQTPKFIYLSSLGEAGEPIHAGLIKYLTKHPDVELVFQPGTFQIREGVNKLKKLYQQSYIFAANKEEFQQILNTKENNEKKLIEKMHKLGPKVVLLTDGPKGAFASDGKQVLKAMPYPDPKPPLDRTGAGDSYTSTFAAALILGNSLSEALQWAGINSMSVVQAIGAQAGLLSQLKIKQFLKSAPKNYKPKQL